MSLASTAVALNAATATKIATGQGRSGQHAEVNLQNRSGTDIYVGDGSVTTTTGLKVVTSDSIFGPIKLGPGDDLYAISLAGTPSINVIVSGS